MCAMEGGGESGWFVQAGLIEGAAYILIRTNLDKLTHGSKHLNSTFQLRKRQKKQLVVFAGATAECVVM